MNAIQGQDFVIHYNRFTKQIGILVRDKDGNQIGDTFTFKSKVQANIFVRNNNLQRVGIK